MKRQPVKKGSLVGAAYPNLHDPEFKALLKRLARGTATASLVGVLGLALPACDLFPGDKAPEAKDTAEDHWDLSGVEMPEPPDTVEDNWIPGGLDISEARDTAEDHWDLPGADAAEPPDTVEEDWVLAGAPAEEVCTTEISTPPDTADVEDDFVLGGDMPMPDKKPRQP